MLIKKKILCTAAAMLCTFGAVAVAAAEIIPGNVDENNNIILTITVDSASTADRNGMLTIFKQEVSDDDLQVNNVQKEQLLLTDIITMPANTAEVNYVVNMDGEASGLYYARVKIGAESSEQTFSYMDKSALDAFLKEMAQNTTADDMYTFFAAHTAELMLDIENDYSEYTIEEKKFALENVLSREFANITEIKKSFENGLLVVDINKADEEGIRTIIEENAATFGIDLSEASAYNKLDDTTKASVWTELSNKDFKITEEVKTAFDEAVNTNYITMLLENIKNSTAETVMDIFTDDAVKALGIETETGVYASYIKNNDKATQRLASLIAGSDWSGAEEAAEKFKEMSIVTAYQTVTDYVKYTELIVGTKEELSLGGKYFTWTSDNARYEVNKLMIANAAALVDIAAIQTRFARYCSEVNDQPSGNTGGSGSVGGGTTVNSSSRPITGNISTPVDETTNTDDTDLAQTDEDIVFDDLEGYEWAEESIYNLAKYSIVNGTGGQKFEPARLIKKEEFCKMLVEAFEIDVENAGCDFTDVSSDAWYYDYIADVYSAEIIKGIGDSMFGTGTEVSREDMCVMLYNAIKYKGYDIPVIMDKINFKDAEHMSPYAENAIEQMQISGIVNGMDEDVFEPKTPTNRAMAATVIERALKLLGRI